MSATQGRWETLTYQSPVLPIHAALLSPGADGRAKVLFFAGSGNNPDNTGELYGSAVWDYEQGTFSRPKTPLNSAGNPIDFFCAGQSFLADGRLLVMGGTERYDPFEGLSDTLAFDPKTLEWTIVQSMESGRWYPTAVTLRDGNVFACSGKEENGLLDTYPEIYSPSIGWSVVNPTPNPPTSPLGMYSAIFLLRDGRLLDVTERKGALTAFLHHQDSLSEVRNVLVDGGYTGDPFADETYTILGASVEVAKRNELHTFAVIPQRWVVERSFAWLEKCRRLWKNCERKLNTSLQFVVLAFLALIMKRS